MEWKISEGMTLRDWLAGQAPFEEIDGMMTDRIEWCAEYIGIPKKEYNGAIHYKNVISKLRYEWADAMLKAREKVN